MVYQTRIPSYWDSSASREADKRKIRLGKGLAFLLAMVRSASSQKEEEEEEEETSNAEAH